MMKASEYITTELVKYGIAHVFMVTGGASMHLNDSLGNHPDLKCVYFHHEQAAAMAAESYARMSGRPACLCVTAGPGSTNAITGVWGAFVDSIPMIVISGQVKTETSLIRKQMRQLGDQEFDIYRAARTFTKVFFEPKQISDLPWHLSICLQQAATGRPGPVWLSVPIDIQSSPIVEARIYGGSVYTFPKASWSNEWESAREKLKTAKRPLVLAGGGIRASSTYSQFLSFIKELGVPVVTAWNAHDLLTNDHPLFVGRPGSVGDRPGNFAVENCDWLLILGSRLNIRQVSYNWKSFAPKAFKVMVDVDPEELNKHTLSIDCKVEADLKDFFEASSPAPKPVPEWLSFCKGVQEKYPVHSKEKKEPLDRPVNPYTLMNALFERLPPGSKVVTGDGTACVTAFQAGIIKRGTRLYTNSGAASMGYALPAAIGAHYATGEEIICIDGDGSFMMNLQELMTVTHNMLPIKIIILDNGGYHSIRQTQNNFFPGREVGCGPASGLGFPDFGKIAHAFGISHAKIDTLLELEAGLRSFLSNRGGGLLVVKLDPLIEFQPRVKSRMNENGKIESPPLYDMWPFLPREELESNLIRD